MVICWVIAVPAGLRHPYPDPGDSQATRDAIDTALSARGSSALAC
jgi:hypothetical protein